MPDSTAPGLFALLIGIDRYSQTPLPDGSYYPNLGGCVRDINHIEQMLRNRLSLTDGQITKLTSAVPKNDAPVEAAAPLPTYENLVKAFKALTDKAKAGDQVYIHYSGHGGRSTTMFEELKGAHGLDESLVPCDIGENGACYLRDIEMAYLLKEMSDKGLIVTLVLDSCHSGGATRGDGGAFVRGISSIDTTPPPETSAVAAKADLIQAFRELPSDATRSVNAASGWRLPTPKNFVLIAACRANELANEYAFDGNERNGALTYWMLDALKQIGDGYTYKMLVNRIGAKIHSKFVNQTPQIEGDGNREIFGGAQLAAKASVNVIKIDLPNQQVQLNTGLAQGVGNGAQFAVYPANATNFADLTQRLAVVELIDAGGSASWARIVEDDKTAEIQEGSQAVLLGIGIRLRGRVRLARQEDLPGEIAQAAALEKLREEITKDEAETAGNEKWIRLAADGEETDFQVAVNFRGEYEIWDANGRNVPNLRPAVNVNDNGAAAQIARRLVHLTKYRNARLIDNTDPTSPLARKIVAELGTQKDPNDKQTFLPFGMQTRPFSVGETVYLRIRNLSAAPVNLAIIDLRPDWSITQVLPDLESGQDYQLLESGAGNALLLPMTLDLPNDYHEGADTLKIFATAEGTDFHWLEMPALDKPPTAPEDGLVRSPNNALEQLMTAFAAPNLRNIKIVNASAPKGGNWATTQVEIRVRRASIAHVADPALSLLQAAFDETIAKSVNGAVKTRSLNGRRQTLRRPELSDPIINEITQYCVAVAQNKLSEDELTAFDNTALKDAQERGVVDTAKYCASMAAGVAREWLKAKVWGDDEKYNEYKAALAVKFGDCDLKYREAMAQYLEFLRNSGHVTYRAYNRLDDQVIDGHLPDDATIGIVADWGTGEPEATEVLRQVKQHNPQIAVHLGDVYYAGTEYEFENYFYQPWKRILELDTSGILSFALPGNHDLYAGGKPFYDLLDKLAAHNGIQNRPASFFCLRNAHWQIIGLDTALYDRLIGGPTHLEDSEAVWLKDKIENAEGRRTILLSHHQLFSANDKFDGKSYNAVLYDQVAPVLSQVDLWLWGHEHDLVIFDEYKNLKRGRCIGGSAFPVGNFEMPPLPANPDVHFNRQVELSKGDAFYQHCYVVLKLDGENATVFYYEDSNGGRLLFQETI